MPARTQKERREATIGRLLDATIQCLIQHGYRDTSIGRICELAGVSHGGLFRHFATRTELLAAATQEVGKRHLRNFSAIVNERQTETDVVDEMVRFFRQATRDPVSAAWREVIVAARTDNTLNASVRPAVKFFEQQIMTMAAETIELQEGKEEFGTLILSLLHMFDSEATTAAIVETEEIQDMRHKWAVNLLKQAYERSG